MTIAEPATTLTDYAMGAVGLVFGGRLVASAARGRHTARALWGTALAATGAAALIGGTSHGFGPYLSTGARWALWRATYGTVGVANLLILAAAAMIALRGAARRAVIVLLSARLVLYLALIAWRPDFRYVVYDYGVTLLALAAFAFHRGLRGHGGAAWLMAGIGVSLAGALMQRGGVALHRHFNHNDLFHVLQTIGIYFYYRAGALLETPADR
jgi:membrane-bound metal-dependent hydrolase YbcI (DUF457 family)